MGANGDGDSDSEDGSTGGPAGTLSLDAIISMLAHQRRRDLLSYLESEPTRTASVNECVSYIVDREEERTGSRPGHEQVEVTFYHVHVPKLVEAGVVEYDDRSREVRYRGHHRLETFLGRVDDDEWETP